MVSLQKSVQSAKTQYYDFKLNLDYLLKQDPEQYIYR